MRMKQIPAWNAVSGTGGGRASFSVRRGFTGAWRGRRVRVAVLPPELAKTGQDAPENRRSVSVANDI